MFTRIFQPKVNQVRNITIIHNMSQINKDPFNLYQPTKGNDQGVVVVQIVIDWYRGHRGQFSSTEATNIGNEITNILNGTHPV